MYGYAGITQSVVVAAMNRGFDRKLLGSYREAMRACISIPDEVLSRADVLARRRRMTRSALFAIAVDAYVRQHRADDVTRRLNRVYATEDSALDPVLARLQVLSRCKTRTR